MMKKVYFCQSRKFVTLIQHLSATRYSEKGEFYEISTHYAYQTQRKYSMGQKKKFLIVGLGNHDIPLTRHSVGMRLVNRLAKYLGVTLEKQKECLGFVAKKELAGIDVVLLKPKLPMNHNGTSVLKTASKYKIPASHIYLVHDDMQREVGKVSVKDKGSALGHNGVKSVIQCFRTDEIPRIRLGIDRPTNKDEVVDYVLCNFAANESAAVQEAVDLGILRLAQHIGARTGLDTARVFSDVEESTSVSVEPSASNHGENDSARPSAVKAGGLFSDDAKKSVTYISENDEKQQAADKEYKLKTKSRKKKTVTEIPGDHATEQNNDKQ